MGFLFLLNPFIGYLLILLRFSPNFILNSLLNDVSNFRKWRLPFYVFTYFHFHYFLVRNQTHHTGFQHFLFFPFIRTYLILYLSTCFTTFIIKFDFRENINYQVLSLNFVLIYFLIKL